jgi:hypothetical protein
VGSGARQAQTWDLRQRGRSMRQQLVLVGVDVIETDRLDVVQRRGQPIAPAMSGVPASNLCGGTL